jgi:membrane protein
VFPPLRLREALTLGGLSARELVVRTWRMMNDHEIWTRAAAISFYAMLAAVPFLGIVLLFAVQLLPDLTGRGGDPRMANSAVAQLEATLHQLFPEDIYKIVLDQIARIQAEPPVGLLSIGLIITLWSASSLYAAIIDALNRIAGVIETRSYIRIRVVAILMTLIEASILVGSLLLILVWQFVLRRMGLSSSGQAIATVILWSVLTLMVSLSFAITFYIGPDAKQRWEWITPGSLLGTIAFLLSSLLFRYYIEHLTHYDKAYGSLGGVMVLLFWFWISSTVLLAAAQLNKVIEDASPHGMRYGQKESTPLAPDLAHAEPIPLGPIDSP